MGNIFSPRDIQVDAVELSQARDLIIEASEGLEHLDSVLLIISFGISQLTFAERDYETSCIQVIRKYIKTLEKEKLTEATNKLEQQIKDNNA